MDSHERSVQVTIRPQPVPFADDEEPVNFKVISVELLVQDNDYEFTTTGDFAKPGANCWFHLLLQFLDSIAPTGGADLDAIVTNGDVYYLVNNSLVPKKRRNKRIHLNKTARELIEKHITDFVSGPPQ